MQLKYFTTSLPLSKHKFVNHPSKIVISSIAEPEIYNRTQTANMNTLIFHLEY